MSESVFKDGILNGRVAFVTGGGTGITGGVARAFDRGVRAVWIHDTDPGVGPPGSPDRLTDAPRNGGDRPLPPRGGAQPPVSNNDAM